MSNQELNQGFDILYNNISSNRAPGLSIYEKSFFLTQAQEQILKAYISPKTNKVQEGYDDSSERQLDFSNLTNTITIKTFNVNQPEKSLLSFNTAKVPSGCHKIVELPPGINTKILSIINEVVIVNRGVQKTEEFLQCIPITYDEYILTQSKPYKFPLRNQAWRLINNGAVQSKQMELIAGYNDTIKAYVIKYLKKPSPIVLEDLTGLSIQGVSQKTECELDPILHQDILQRAVELAKAAYTSGSFADLVSTGLTSGTNLGIIPQRRGEINNE